MKPLPYCEENNDFDEAELCTKLLADKHRLRIICFLRRGERTVTEIVEELGIAQNLSSHHIRILLEGGILTARKERHWTYYSLDAAKLHEYGMIMKRYIGPIEE